MKKETELKSVNDRIEQESGKVKYENKKDILKKRFHKVYFSKIGINRSFLLFFDSSSTIPKVKATKKVGFSKHFLSLFHIYYCFL